METDRWGVGEGSRVAKAIEESSVVEENDAETAPKDGAVLATLVTLAALALDLFDARRAGEMLGGGAAIGDLIFCARRARSAYETGAAIGITEEMADDSISATIPNQRIIPTHLDTHKNCRRK